MLVLMLVAALGLSPAAAPKKAPKANAKSAANSWVVLVKADPSLPPSWGPALRRAAEAEDPKVAWVEPPAVSLEEAQLAAGCASWGPACAGLIASLVGAQTALVIELAPSGDGAAVTVQPVRATGVALQNAERGELPGRDTDSLKLAEAYVRGALRGQRPTLLVLTTDVPNAEVVIDGRLRGRTPLTLVDDVEPGEHTVLFRLEGRAPVTRSVDVKAGVTNKEHALLGALGPAMVVQPTVENPVGSDPPPMPASPAAAEDHAGADRIFGWGLIGVGGVAAVAAGGAASYIGYWNFFGNNSAPLPFLFPYAGREEYCEAKPCTVGGSEYGDERKLVAEGSAATALNTSLVIAAAGLVAVGSGALMLLLSGPTPEDADAAASAAR